MFCPGRFPAFESVSAPLLLSACVSLSACFVSPGPHYPLLCFNSFSSASLSFFCSHFPGAPPACWTPARVTPFVGLFPNNRLVLFPPVSLPLTRALLNPPWFMCCLWAETPRLFSCRNVERKKIENTCSVFFSH